MYFITSQDANPNFEHISSNLLDFNYEKVEILFIKITNIIISS